MSRWWLLVALGLALALTACGGDDDDASDGVDASPGPDGAVGVDEPAAGQFVLAEVHFGDDVYTVGQAFGTIVDPRPRYHTLADESPACKRWTFEVGDCGGYCDGVCSPEGECLPHPTQLSAGDVSLTSPGADLVLRHESYGYYNTEIVSPEIFAPGDRVALDAAGGDDVAAFSLETAGVEAIDLPLEVGGEDGADALRIEDGGDLVLTWSPAVQGARVRLEILSNNVGHGFPVDAMIECEADDTGRIAVPRAMVEAFPDKPYQNICAGSDCPPSSLTRFRADRVEVGGREIELRASAVRQFIVVHEPE
jgi:hypothetical protein